MTTEKRAQWGSKVGFILAAAGSAVGLGNIWRFPYITQENGGGLFVLLYLAAVVFIGLPVMLGEFAIGRHTQSNPVGAYRAIKPGWKFLGLLGVLTGFCILAYYSVVAGWTLAYIVKSATGELDPAGFGPFLGQGSTQVFYLFLFMFLTCSIVIFGVQKGIERMSKILMPLLVILLLALIIRGLTLPTAAEGLKFYLLPDFSQISMKMFLLAVGQAFFSLSLGMGAMLTYGGYMNKKDNMFSAATAVVTFDTSIALLAGFMIFPVIGHSLAKGGPTLVFVTMIEQFNQMTGGRWLALMFFVLLAVAALTSTVSLLEVVTAWLIDEWKIPRQISVILIGILCFAMAVPSALSLGASDFFTDFAFGQGVLDLMDFVFGNLSLTLGGFLMCIFIVYRWGIDKASAEILTGAPGFGRFVPIWRVLLGFVVPASIGSMIIYMIVTGGAL